MCTYSCVQFKIYLYMQFIYLFKRQSTLPHARAKYFLSRVAVRFRIIRSKKQKKTPGHRDHTYKLSRAIGVCIFLIFRLLNVYLVSRLIINYYTNFPHLSVTLSRSAAASVHNTYTEKLWQLTSLSRAPQHYTHTHTHQLRVCVCV